MTIIDARTPADRTSKHLSVTQHPTRTARTRHYVMCTPSHFAVEYAINPWMDPTIPVDSVRATQQWDVLRRAYLSLGHRVDVIAPVPGQPDMVFAANGGITVGGRSYGAKFRHPQREAEAQAFTDFLRAEGHDVVEPVHVNEGEGDFLALSTMILAGTGFRTSIEAHVEAAEALDRPVVSLRLVDPRFYHLDTALAVLDDGGGDAPADIAYYPGAFSPHSRRTLRDLFPDAVQVSEMDALVLGLNAVSDGLNIVLPAAAIELAETLKARGYVPVPVELGELLKSGGSVKCCTMELHA
ncbi:dimethylargininase [Aeromicrobium sp.]|uniref:dimethylargininase n=1 Tax=Aeromicrobium sp. TaxID=1871063 RepID=UPI003C482CB3